MNRRRFLTVAVGGAAAAAVAVGLRPDEASTTATSPPSTSPQCAPPPVPGEDALLPYGGVATHLWYFETQYGDTARVAEHLRQIEAPIARDEWLIPKAWPEYRGRYGDALELVHTVAG
ncbi:MAG TPA: twin-arginine translocation signal domain-containing protein, partial [Acidimicrobiales bacterium]|nr:twin-arginine translocation signal domain-containing protein [Acidimicrobiales bacterium]